MTVEKSDDTWDYTCDACGFVSSRWPTKADATARGGQHEAEHETGKPMPEIADFERGAE